MTAFICAISTDLRKTILTHTPLTHTKQNTPQKNKNKQTKKQQQIDQTKTTKNHPAKQPRIITNNNNNLTHCIYHVCRRGVNCTVHWSHSAWASFHVRKILYRCSISISFQFWYVNFRMKWTGSYGRYGWIYGMVRTDAQHSICMELRCICCKLGRIQPYSLVSPMARWGCKCLDKYRNSFSLKRC